MLKSKNWLFLTSLLLIPVIIYFYFLQWKTNTIYGDDLYLYKGLTAIDSISDAVNMEVNIGKFRPVHGLSSLFLFNFFHKNLDGYYLFNILIQSVNTYILALLLNLFLRSSIFSLAISLVYGLSRFSFFNISQLFNGGGLEGIAITFFLLSVFSIVRVIKKTDLTPVQRQSGLLWSILWANLSMYTHERYIVLLPFLIAIIIFFPGIKTVGNRARYIAGLTAVGSIVLNVIIKNYGYSIPFFVGTGGTNITFSFPTAFAFLMDAILSIFQLNSGPEYLIGVKFLSLQGFNLILVLFIAACTLGILVVYLLHVRKAFVAKQEDRKNDFYIFLFLFILFGLCLAPAIVTIRLEQRWLQASFSIFIVLLVIALSSMWKKNNPRLIGSALFLAACFILANYTYLHRGVRGMYMKDAENAAAIFKDAIKTGIIAPSTSILYIWEQHNDVNADNGIDWAIGEGRLFEFYQQKEKKIVFADSIYRKAEPFGTSFPGLEKGSAQILYIKGKITDITDLYLRDSLKNFQY